MGMFWDGNVLLGFSTSLATVQFLVQFCFIQWEIKSLQTHSVQYVPCMEVKYEHVPCNLGIFVHSRDCTVHSQNPKMVASTCQTMEDINHNINLICSFTPLALGCIHSRTCTCISLSHSVPWMVCLSKDGVERVENSSTCLCVHTHPCRCSSSKRTKNLSTAGTMRLVTQHSTSPADMDTLWATDILLFLPTCPLCTDTQPHSQTPL